VPTSQGPPVGLLLGNADFSNLALTLREASTGVEPVTVNYGVFISTVLDFLIVAASIFLVIKQMNRLRSQPPEAPKEPTTKSCPRCFTEIPVKATRCPACTSDLGLT